MKRDTPSLPPADADRRGLDPDGATPLYAKLRVLLARQIEEGRYRPDQAIPSERELCRRYGISRITVRQAIGAMIHEGVLYRQPGKGTFVARRTVNQGLSRIVTFSRTVMDIGMKPATRILAHGLQPAALEVAEILRLPDASQVMRLLLLGSGDGRPLVLYESFFAPEVGKKMLGVARAKERRRQAFSSYDLYGKPSGIFPARVHQSFEAVAADDPQARLLAVPPQTALLKVTSVFAARDGSPLELRRALYRGDFYKFTIVRDLR